MPHRHLTLLTLAAFGFGLWAASRRNGRRDAAGHALVKPEALQTWEGEGGGLPNGAPGRPITTPTPDARDAADATP